MTNLNQKTYTFHINGLHCKSCVLITESELRDVSYIYDAKTLLESNTVEVSGNFGDMSIEDVMKNLSRILEPHGYSLSMIGTDQGKTATKKWSDFIYAVPIALAFAVIFIILQKIGLVNLITAGEVTYGTAFLIGVIASLSTCMAVIGGLVLSMSATFAKKGDKVKPQILFHVGRITSFFLLGGVMGLIGTAFTLNATGMLIVSLIVGLVMIVLGINLLDVFHWSKKFQPVMPAFISKRAFKVSKFNHTITPLLVGVATFFLPCGFTQSMQLYTLTTGSFMHGGLTMTMFALGTLPALALISFSSLAIHRRQGASIFFKTAGLIVIMFAIVNLINSLVAAGLISPIFNI